MTSYSNKQPFKQYEANQPKWLSQITRSSSRRKTIADRVMLLRILISKIISTEIMQTI